MTLDDGGDWKYRIRGKDLVETLERVEPGDDRDHAWHFMKNCADKARPVLMEVYTQGGLVAKGRRVVEREGGTLGLDGGYEPVGTREDKGGAAVDVEAAKEWLNDLGPGLRIRP